MIPSFRGPHLPVAFRKANRTGLVVLIIAPSHTGVDNRFEVAAKLRLLTSVPWSTWLLSVIHYINVVGVGLKRES